MTTRIRILARKITSHSIADRQGSKNGFFRDHSSSFFCGGGGGGGWLWTLANIEISWPWPHSWLIWQIYYLAESANPAFWLATRAGNMGLSCPLGISRSGPARKIFPFSPYNKFSVDQVCSVKMAGYWPRSVLRFYWPQRRKRTWPVYRHLDLTLRK